MRKGINKKDDLIIACNFTPILRLNYRVGIEKTGKLKEIFNTDDQKYGGSGSTDNKTLKVESIPWHGHKKSMELDIPPLGIVIIK
jgi:1,4-alpha-glucan branching enzyme